MKIWLQKSVCNGYIIRETLTDTEGSESVTITTDHRFDSMWDAIKFYNV